MGRTAKKKDEVVGQVYLTDDLDKFKFVEGNRVVTRNRRLKAHIEKKGILEPITVNKKMEVTDGQHRLAIARELGISVPYKFSEESTASIMEINNTQKAWKLTDYIGSYASVGKREYVRLSGLLNKYPALLNSKTAQQARGVASATTSNTDSVKRGELKFKNYPEYVKFVKSYQKFIDTTRLRSVSGVQEAYFMLFSLTPFDAKRFTKKVVARNLVEQLNGVTSFPRIMRAFVEANNSGLSVKSKNWISLTTDELSMGHLNNDYNEKLLNSAPVFRMK